MNIPPCKGRERVIEKDRKWYIDKNKSAELYTCCEECYVKYIKNTPNEDNYTEIQHVINPNCDYFLYETDCNFEDCSFVKNNIRVSVVDNMGKRYKKTLIENTIYIPNDIKTYNLIIENLLMEKGTTKLSLENCSINNKQINILYDMNTLFSIIELNIDEGFVNDEYDDIHLSISQYIKHDFFPITELPQNENGVIYNTLGTPLLQIKNKPNEKTKAVLGVDVYKCDNSKITDFYLTVINNNIDELNELNDLTICI